MKTKTLIISPAWVGDIVMAQALFKLLKAQNSAVIIDILAPAWAHPLLQRMPEINQCITSAFQHGKLQLRERFKLARELRAEKYDHVIILPNSFKSALVPWLAKIPLRTGWAREGRSILLNDSRKLNKQKLPLMVQRFLTLGLSASSHFEQSEKTFFPKLVTDFNAITKALTSQQLIYPSKPVLGLCPGAAYGPAKRWPVEYFAEIARNKVAAGWAVWIFGSASEQVLAHAIQEASGNICVDLTSKTSLGEAIDLMSLTSAIVANDSGLMHIAAALDKPLVALYGSSSSAFTPPLSDKAEILSLHLECSPCFARVCPLKHFKCMNDLSPQLVLQALMSLETRLK